MKKLHQNIAQQREGDKSVNRSTIKAFDVFNKNRAFAMQHGNVVIIVAIT